MDILDIGIDDNVDDGVNLLLVLLVLLLLVLVLYDNGRSKLAILSRI